MVFRHPLHEPSLTRHVGEKNNGYEGRGKRRWSWSWSLATAVVSNAGYRTSFCISSNAIDRLEGDLGSVVQLSGPSLSGWRSLAPDQMLGKGVFCFCVTRHGALFADVPDCRVRDKLSAQLFAWVFFFGSARQGVSRVADALKMPNSPGKAGLCYLAAGGLAG